MFSGFSPFLLGMIIPSSVTMKRCVLNLAYCSEHRPGRFTRCPGASGFHPFSTQCPNRSHQLRTPNPGSLPLWCERASEVKGNTKIYPLKRLASEGGRIAGCFFSIAEGDFHSLQCFNGCRGVIYEGPEDTGEINTKNKL